MSPHTNHARRGLVWLLVSRTRGAAAIYVNVAHLSVVATARAARTDTFTHLLLFSTRVNVFPASRRAAGTAGVLNVRYAAKRLSTTGFMRAGAPRCATPPAYHNPWPSICFRTPAHLPARHSSGAFCAPPLDAAGGRRRHPTALLPCHTSAACQLCICYCLCARARAGLLSHCSPLPPVSVYISSLFIYPFVVILIHPSLTTPCM